MYSGSGCRGIILIRFSTANRPYGPHSTRRFGDGKAGRFVSTPRLHERVAESTGFV
jgi:hypothetical protein